MPTELQTRIIALVADNHDTAVKLAKAMGASRQSTRQALLRIEIQGLVQQVGGKRTRWRLTLGGLRIAGWRPKGSRIDETNARVQRAIDGDAEEVPSSNRAGETAAYRGIRQAGPGIIEAEAHESMR